MAGKAKLLVDDGTLLHLLAEVGVATTLVGKAFSFLGELDAVTGDALEDGLVLVQLDEVGLQRLEAFVLRPTIGDGVDDLQDDVDVSFLLQFLETSKHHFFSIGK